MKVAPPRVSLSKTLSPSTLVKGAPTGESPLVLLTELDGTPLILHTRTGQVVSLHGDATLREIALQFAGASDASEFADALAEAGAGIAFEQLLSLAAAVRTWKSWRPREVSAAERTRVIAKGLGLTMKKLMAAASKRPAVFEWLGPLNDVEHRVLHRSPRRQSSRSSRRCLARGRRSWAKRPSTSSPCCLLRWCPTLEAPRAPPPVRQAASRLDPARPRSAGVAHRLERNGSSDAEPRAAHGVVRHRVAEVDAGHQGPVAVRGRSPAGAAAEDGLGVEDAREFKLLSKVKSLQRVRLANTAFAADRKGLEALQRALRPRVVEVL